MLTNKQTNKQKGSLSGNQRLCGGLRKWQIRHDTCKVSDKLQYMEVSKRTYVCLWHINGNMLKSCFLKLRYPAYTNARGTTEINEGPKKSKIKAKLPQINYSFCAFMNDFFHLELDLTKLHLIGQKKMPKLIFICFTIIKPTIKYLMKLSRFCWIQAR